MFKKSGKCIQRLATVLHVINIIVALFAAVVCGFLILESTDTVWGFVLGAVGALLLILLSWLSLMFMHAYGTIAANSEAQSRQLEKLTFVTSDILSKLNTAPKQTSGAVPSHNSAPAYKAPVAPPPSYQAPAPAYRAPANPVYAPPAAPAPAAVVVPVSFPEVSEAPVVNEPAAVNEAPAAPAPVVEPVPAPVATHCAHCGAKLSKGAKFCTFCGHAQ